MPTAHSDWLRARRTESQYGVQLRKIARHIGEIIRSFDLRDAADASLLQMALKRYSEIVGLWAPSAARAMVAEAAARSNKPWRKISAELGLSFADTFHGPDMDHRFRQLQNEQVVYITSIPLDAAQRVHELVEQGFTEGKRFTDLVPEIRRGGEVSVSKANLIARTETGRVVTNLTQARSESVGSSSYIWRTVRDAQVRPSHRAMEGQPVRWDRPPTLDGLTGHAGAVPNCFLGSAKVNLTHCYEKFWRRKYSGSVVTLGLGDGSSSEATPNHPMLTQRGWLAIDEVEKGDYLIKRLGQRNHVGDIDSDELVTRFDDLFDAISARLKPETSCGTKFDFHGDGREDDVDVVSVEGLLQDDGSAAVPQGIREFGFPWPARTQGGFAFRVGGPRPEPSVDGIRGPSPRGLVGGERKFLPLDVAHAGLAHEHSLRSVPDIDVVVREPESHDVSRHAILGRQFLDARSVQVRGDHLCGRQFNASDDSLAVPRRPLAPSAELFAEIVRAATQDSRSIFEAGTAVYEFQRVVKKTRRELSAHVYTAQTRVGWYIADKYVAHNCRCYCEPVIPMDLAPARPRFMAAAA